MWNSAIFRGGYCKGDNVIAVYAWVIDVDNKIATKEYERMKDPPPATPLYNEKGDVSGYRLINMITPEKLVVALNPLWDVTWHTSYQSTAQWPRFRGVVPFSKPLTRAQYEAGWRGLAGGLVAKGIYLDPQCKDASRQWYFPAHNPTFISGRREGRAIDSDALTRLCPVHKEVPKAPAVAIREAVSEPISSDAIVERARRYVARMPGAVSGDNGHIATFLVAEVLVRGFCLDADIALQILAQDHNPECDPPWSERELKHKVKQALEKGQMEIGCKLKESIARAPIDCDSFEEVDQFEDDDILKDLLG